MLRPDPAALERRDDDGSAGLTHKKGEITPVTTPTEPGPTKSATPAPPEPPALRGAGGKSDHRGTMPRRLVEPMPDKTAPDQTPDEPRQEKL